MNFAELSIAILSILRPHYEAKALPSIPTALAAKWLQDGFDGQKIVEIIRETVAKKLFNGKEVPISLNYYDSIIRANKPVTVTPRDSEDERTRDERVAKNIRFKLKMLMGGIDTRIERELQSLEAKYGHGFGIEKPPIGIGGLHGQS